MIHEYGRKVKALDLLLSKRLSQTLTDLKVPFTDAQSALLMVLFHHQDKPVYQRDLPRILGVSGPTGNGLVKRLVQKKAIRMIPDDQDSRLKRLVLSDNIRVDIVAQQTQFELAFQRTESEMTKNFSDAEKLAFDELLRKAIQNLKSSF
ncbi:hypothetical protein YK48G_18590 [Lentilactobacillus fungorum]|uniref:HTH marR-type domain-containing protein n=1 Tax=Lentilactobacillus fungorum TaxID=2201250 RepID=A0ABQ3W2U7_9LACO|nr:MarR family transcriptional regulator [Lentilactobacillus fungorum]GHP14434.1 hypothetical protein YK48G_18590 [Lentilactobacillus fungorum]